MLRRHRDRRRGSRPVSMQATQLPHPRKRLPQGNEAGPTKRLAPDRRRPTLRRPRDRGPRPCRSRLLHSPPQQASDRPPQQPTLRWTRRNRARRDAVARNPEPWHRCVAQRDAALRVVRLPDARARSTLRRTRRDRLSESRRALSGDPPWSAIPLREKQAPRPAVPRRPAASPVRKSSPVHSRSRRRNVCAAISSSCRCSASLRRRCCAESRLACSVSKASRRCCRSISSARRRSMAT